MPVCQSAGFGSMIDILAVILQTVQTDFLELSQIVMNAACLPAGSRCG